MIIIHFLFSLRGAYATSKIVESFPTRIKAQLVNFLSQQYISGNNFSCLTISHFYINAQILEYFERNTISYDLKIQGTLFTNEFDRAQ